MKTLYKHYYYFMLIFLVALPLKAWDSCFPAADTNQKSSIIAKDAKPKS